MLSRQKNQGKNSSGFSTTPEQTGLFRSRPFNDQTASDEVSPQNQDLPDLQTLQDKSARFSQSLSRMKVYGSRPAIQPKLSVGAPGDKYEQEADQMAQQVMSMPAPVSHPPIQRLEKQEEEKEPVQTKALAASITPLVQRETAPEELEEEKEPVQMKRSLQETAEVSIQRDGTEALPAVPNYQLTPPSLLQPPDPSSRYGLGQNSQLHLDPQIQAMAFQYVQQQMEPATIRAALSQVNLGLTALPTPSASGPTATPTPNPFATPSPSPAAPLVPRGAGPDTPRPASAGDLMSALLAVPAIDAWIMSLKTRATEQMVRDWRRLSTGEQVGVVSSAVAIGAGALAGILSDPNARQMALSQLNGRVLPVPGLNWLSLEINTGGNNLMLGGHVDIGRLLPPSLGFGPSSPSAIGGPPTPQPFVPGQPPVQRKATPEAEEEKVQMKPLANAMIQREAMPEAAEEVQTQPSLQRTAENGSFYASSDIESQLSSSKGGASPLPSQVRTFMEPRFGADFSQVKVHTDTNAVQMNKELGAQAFAHGSDIYFGEGKSPGNDALTAHELTHVLQQTGAGTIQRSLFGAIVGGVVGAAAGLVGGPIGAIAGAIGGAAVGDSLTNETRPLTAAEKQYAQPIYLNSLDYDAITIVKDSALSTGASRTVGNRINLESDLFEANSMNLTSQGQEILIHEMGHVWQYQHGGLSYIPLSLVAQAKAGWAGNRDQAYDWRSAHNARIPWSEWNPEQQAEAIEDYNAALRRSQAHQAMPEDHNTLAILLPYIQKVQAGEGAP